MTQPPRPRPPLWAALCLMGVAHRLVAVACGWFALGVGVFCAVCGFWDWRFWPGTVFLLAAPWYGLAVRWADRHNYWNLR